MTPDAWTSVAGTADRAFMALYAHARRNARRIMQLMMAFVPLLMLLVGSCKTSELPGSYGSNAGPDQFRVALFPDRVNYTGADYYPARGYISRAQTYVAGVPQALMQLTEQEIGYLFGTPTVERRDADARVWQYRGKACVVDIYFYQEKGRDKGYSVTHVDFRPSKPGTLVDDVQQDAIENQSSCIRTLVRSGAAAPVKHA